ncbi:hypothetical protein PC9H_009001 [Pleurotus ostreatus]|uniref:RNase H type-1 domain-containing protein n=1 Tax=Pleurotus ostreatus TaxID=5322 RepID=A0A8H7DR38_PLEOS|nr:uncharacterized protein PC9H_009001 [Pleurotus ostreatus]KAF7426632.1 hypothetical protein PC9H_009001 [Pleurotus ostreatus]
MAIYDTSPHPSQDAVSWSPGHSGIRGNERADTLAKAAAAQRPFIGSTIAWAKANAKAKALEQWVKQWKESAKTSPSALSLTHPPSYKLAKFHRTFTGNRRTYSHTIQASLGHAFVGEYFSCFVPRLPSSCPCDDTLLQTRAHVLTECPLHEHARHILREASSSLSLDFLLGTQKGLAAIAKFIQHSTAFRRHD